MATVNYKKPKVILFFKERVTDPLEGEKIINQKRLYPNEDRVKTFIEKLANSDRNVWDIGYKIIHKAEVNEDDGTRIFVTSHTSR